MTWKNHRALTIIYAFIENTSIETILKMFHLPYLSLNRGNWKWFRLETILNNIDMKKASWFNHILSTNREYKPRNYLKLVSFTLLNMNRCNWQWFRLETILNNIDMKKASWFNHVLSINRQYKPRNYFKMFHLPSYYESR